MRRYKWKLLILFSIFFIFNTKLSAQNSIRALITDSATHEKLAGVVMVVKGTNNAAETDSVGNIELKGIPDGTQIVEVSYIGYQKQSIRLQFPLMNGKTIPVLLQQEQSELDANNNLNAPPETKQRRTNEIMAKYSDKVTELNKQLAEVQKPPEASPEVPVASTEPAPAPEVAEVSTPFPKSKVQETVYHGTKEDFNAFDKSKIGTATDEGWWG